MRRRLTVSLGLALAVATGLWLLHASRRPARTSAEPERGAHADIDDASRAALEKILEAADEREGHEAAAREDGQRR